MEPRARGKRMAGEACVYPTRWRLLKGIKAAWLKAIWSHRDAVCTRLRPHGRRMPLPLCRLTGGGGKTHCALAIPAPMSVCCVVGIRTTYSGEE